MEKLYYTAPSDEMFQEIKDASIKVWQTMDNTYGYVDEKVDSIKNLQNVRDNYMYMVAMFDINNQMKLFSLLSEETKIRILDAMS